MQTETKYQVIDSKTGMLMGTYASRKLASRKADKLDMEYGAIRYSVRVAAPKFDIVEMVESVLGLPLGPKPIK